MDEPTPTPDERALLDAILADPDDDDLRLVYADWLEERGDPRAEFLRREVAIDRGELSYPKYWQALEATERERKHLDTEWLKIIVRDRPDYSVRDAHDDCSWMDARPIEFLNSSGDLEEVTLQAVRQRRGEFFNRVTVHHFFVLWRCWLDEGLDFIWITLSEWHERRPDEFWKLVQPTLSDDASPERIWMEILECWVWELGEEDRGLPAATLALRHVRDPDRRRRLEEARRDIISRIEP